MRTEKDTQPLHAPLLDEHVADALFERATDLAYQRFGEATSDDHIEWAYQRMVGNWQWGLGSEGVVTVH